MPMGDYNEDEHERREQKATAVDAEFTDDRTSYEGTVDYDDGSTAEDLLDQFNEING